tara:strand:+ start:660 stop:866 length:207 start_codon:yes stop_codon:yes gene_type:complete
MLEDKKKKMEYYDSESKEWVQLEMTEEEILDSQFIHEEDAELLSAEYKIIQRVIEMHTGTHVNSKSTD